MAEQNEMDKIITPMMEHVCDKLCRFPWEITDQEEMSRICHECKMNQYEQEIRDTYNRINDFDKSQCAYMLQELAKEREKQTEVSLVDDGAFGICPDCGYEFDSELLSEYNSKFCLNCGKKIGLMRTE